MDVYFSPLACSMATRIALYEAGASANYLEVDPKTKVVQNDGSDFRKVNPLGLVPTLRTDDGLVLTENAAILQYVADSFPQAGISTGPGMERSRLHQWLCFIGTELHKGLFVPMLDKKASLEVKTYILGKGLSRLDYLENYLRGREFLLDAVPGRTRAAQGGGVTRSLGASPAMQSIVRSRWISGSGVRDVYGPGGESMSNCLPARSDRPSSAFAAPSV